jgi:hypothetical protein
MIPRWRQGLAAWLLGAAVAGAGPASAQTQAPAAPAEAKKDEKAPTLWDEFRLFSYIEIGGTINLHGKSKGVPGSTSSGDTNLLRLYDLDEGFTFNVAEFSIKRDPNEAFPFGMGLVLTAGIDPQKNHSVGPCATTTTPSRSGTRRSSTSRRRTCRGGSPS